MAVNRNDLLKEGSVANENGFVSLCPSKDSNKDLTTLEQVDLKGRIQNIFCDLYAFWWYTYNIVCGLAKGALLIV